MHASFLGQSYPSITYCKFFSQAAKFQEGRTEPNQKLTKKTPQTIYYRGLRLKPFCEPPLEHVWW